MPFNDLIKKIKCNRNTLVLENLKLLNKLNWSFLSLLFYRTLSNGSGNKLAKRFSLQNKMGHKSGIVTLTPWNPFSLLACFCSFMVVY